MKRTTIRGVRIERVPYTHQSDATEHLRYTIDEYDERGELIEVLGRLRDLDAALAAFAALVAKFPEKLIFLRWGAQVLRRSDRPKDQPKA